MLIRTKTQSRLLFFYFITTAGSTLSSIATFVSIEPYFGNLTYTGIALSIRTLSAALLSLKSPSLMSRIGIQRSFIFSQIFGLISLLVLAAGFAFHSISTVLLGVVLAGLPSTFVTIMMTATLRITTSDDHAFRKYSSSRELLQGFAMIGASLLAPLLLLKFSILTVFFIDAITFILGLITLPEVKNESKTEASHSMKDVLSSLPTKHFILQTSGALLLAGLVPLAASSQQLRFLQNLPTAIREAAWSIEGFTIIVASSLYLFFKRFLTPQFKFIRILLGLSSLGLIPLIWNVSALLSILVLIFVSLVTSIAIQLFRDDYILAAGSNSNAIKQYSAFSVLQRSLVYAVSPLFLSVSFQSTDFKTAVFFIFGTQLVFLIANYSLHPSMRKSSGSL